MKESQNKTQAKKKTSSKSSKSSKSKNKKSKWGVIRTVLIVAVVVAVAWFFGGKPKVEFYEGEVLLTQTEEPLINKITSALRQKTDDILNLAVFPQDGESESNAEADVKADVKTGQSDVAKASESSSVSADEKSQTVKSNSVKSSTGTKGSSAADLGHEENSPLFFGNPSDSLNDKAKSQNYLMEKKQYTLSYNTQTLCPNWVAWHLGSSDMGEADRSNDFRPDVELPSEWYAITKADYQYNSYGFDRGHVCPSADRTASKEDNSMTFLMTNMVPQTPDNNRVIWMHFENYERQLVNQGNEVYIIAGPYGTGGTSAKGTFDSIPVTLKSGEVLNMNVPASTWKVCLVIPEGTDDISKITKDTTTIAINVPNQMGMGKTGDWEQFLTSIDEIEALTGYDFFELLPDDIEDALESKVYEYSK